MSERVARVTFPSTGAPTGAYGGTVEMSCSRLGRRPVLLGSPGPRRHPGGGVRPLGRPFALPKEAVTCLLVGGRPAAAPLFPFAERLRERDCAVHVLLGAARQPQLFGRPRGPPRHPRVTVTP